MHISRQRWKTIQERLSLQKQRRSNWYTQAKAATLTKTSQLPFKNSTVLCIGFGQLLGGSSQRTVMLGCWLRIQADRHGLRLQGSLSRKEGRPVMCPYWSSEDSSAHFSQIGRGLPWLTLLPACSSCSLNWAVLSGLRGRGCPAVTWGASEVWFPGKDLLFLRGEREGRNSVFLHHAF